MERTILAHKFYLKLIILSLYIATTQSDVINNNLTHLTDPLHYTRLRFEDFGYLQILRNFQNEYTYLEKAVSTNYSYKDYYNKTVHTDIKYYESVNYENAVLKRELAILEVIDRIYLSKILHYQVYSYDNPNDRMDSSDPKIVSIERCNTDIDLILLKLNELANSKEGEASADEGALSFFDTYGNDEPGLISGNTLWLGDWKSCQEKHVFSLPQKSNTSLMDHAIKGRHCIASIRNPDWEEVVREKVDFVSNLSNTRPHFKYPEQQFDYARFFKLQIGICLPESCDSNLINTRKDDIHRLVTHWLDEQYKSYELSDLYCPPDDNSLLMKLDFEAWLFIGFACFWMSLILAATLMDYVFSKIEAHERLTAALSMNNRQTTPDETNGGYLPAQTIQSPVNRKKFNNEQMFLKFRQVFSLIRNFKKVMSTKASFKVYKRIRRRLEERKEGDKQRVKCKPAFDMEIAQFLNAYKFLAMLTVIFGHCLMVKWDLTKYPLDFGRFHSNISWDYDLTAPFAVDWFFFLTGLITSSTVFITKSVYKNTPFQWFYSVIRRYWRLAPLYIILFWFMRSIFFHLGSGPLWDYGTHNMTIRSICRRESWLYPLTLTSNFHPLHDECIMASWYLGVDLQFYILTPFLLIALAKSAFFGWVLNLSIMILSILLRFNHYMTSGRVKPLDLLRPRADFIMRNNWDNSQTYLYPQMRISSYIIGILTGHYIYMVSNGKWTSILNPVSQNPVDGSRNVQRSMISENSKTSSESQANESIELPEIEANSGCQKEESKREKEANDKKEKDGQTITIIEPTTVLENEATVVPVDHGVKEAKFMRKIVWWIGFGWVISITSASFCLKMFPQSLEPHAKLIASLVYSLDHTIITIGLALVTVTMFFGQYPRIQLILAHPFFTILSRLNLILFMIQVELIYYLLQSSEYYTDRSFNDQTMLSMNTLFIGVALTAVLMPLLELPLLNLEKLFTETIFKSPPKRRNKEAPQQPEPVKSEEPQQKQQQSQQEANQAKPKSVSSE